MEIFPWASDNLKWSHTCWSMFPVETHFILSSCLSVSKDAFFESSGCMDTWDEKKRAKSKVFGTIFRTSGWVKHKNAHIWRPYCSTVRGLIPRVIVRYIRNFWTASKRGILKYQSSERDNAYKKPHHIEYHRLVCRLHITHENYSESSGCIECLICDTLSLQVSKAITKISSHDGKCTVPTQSLYSHFFVHKISIGNMIFLTNLFSHNVCYVLMWGFTNKSKYSLVLFTFGLSEFIFQFKNINVLIASFVRK